MARTQLLRLTREGKAYYCDAKVAWGKVYYSFDFDRSTWHKTKAEAYTAARVAGTLQEVGTVRSVICE